MSKAVIVAALGLSVSSLAFAADQGASAYEPFPNGYGYMDPNEIAALQRARQDGDRAIVRLDAPARSERCVVYSPDDRPLRRVLVDGKVSPHTDHAVELRRLPALVEFEY